MLHTWKSASDRRKTGPIGLKMADLSIGRSRIVRFILVGSRSLVLARLHLSQR
jgi:hypothetical protein